LEISQSCNKKGGGNHNVSLLFHQQQLKIERELEARGHRMASQLGQSEVVSDITVNLPNSEQKGKCIILVTSDVTSQGSSAHKKRVRKKKQKMKDNTWTINRVKEL